MAAFEDPELDGAEPEGPARDAVCEKPIGCVSVVLCAATDVADAALSFRASVQ